MKYTAETYRHFYIDFLSTYLVHPDLEAHKLVLSSSWENIESEYSITVTTDHVKYFTECHFYSSLMINNNECRFRFLMADFNQGKSIVLEYQDTSDGKVEINGDFKELEEWLHLAFHKHKIREFLNVYVTPE